MAAGVLSLCNFGRFIPISADQLFPQFLFQIQTCLTMFLTDFDTPCMYETQKYGHVTCKYKRGYFHYNCGMYSIRESPEKPPYILLLTSGISKAFCRQNVHKYWILIFGWLIPLINRGIYAYLPNAEAACITIYCIWKYLTWIKCYLLS